MMIKKEKRNVIVQKIEEDKRLQNMYIFDFSCVYKYIKIYVGSNLFLI